LKSKDEFEIPTINELTDDSNVRGEFKWVEEDWIIDSKWTSVDEEGWEYSNQRWENRRDSRVLGSFTRRRKWIRNLRLVEK
jgi:hypothetical protein